MHKRVGAHALLIGVLATTAGLVTAESRASDTRQSQQDVRAARPNVVLIFTDDQGYGDLSCYGSTTIQTPRIDQLAREGTRFTSFYAQTVCGPSRSALLTGRYPVRSGGWSMPASEITVAQLLQQAGYATACIGKWDVSNRAPVFDRMPNAKGFDYYYGPLGANDNGTVVLYENNVRLGRSRDMAGLTRTYTDKGIEFLQENKDRPFFLYLAHTMLHSVVDASEAFRGTSQAGLYGDAVQELDFHVGRLLDAIDELGLRDNTLVLFTSDNGPWSNFQEELLRRHHGQIAWGSSGPLREAKGSTYEGGVRVPCIARWPGQVPAGRTSDAIFATIDFLPTFGRLAGFVPPADRLIDGVDQTDLLLGRSESGARSSLAYFCKGELHGVRLGKWKLLLANRQRFHGYVDDRGSGEVELYDLHADLGETTNVAAEHPDVVKDLLAHARAIPLPQEPYRLGIALKPYERFRQIFNARDLTGWIGNDPHRTNKAPVEEREAVIAEQQPEFQSHWRVENGELVNDGHGPYATTVEEFGDIELHLEYRTVPKADSGIYLRGTPQIQIWDTTQEGGKWDRNADKGSGGLFNNRRDTPGQLPLAHADKPFGQWNKFRIRQIGSRTTVHLNNVLVVDNAIMENYWDDERKRPLPPRGPIHLQTHGGEIRWRNIYVREISAEEANALLRGNDKDDGFVSVFNGRDFTGWAGAVDDYEVRDRALVCKPGRGGVLYTSEEYDDFVVRLEFMLPPGGNNGLAIRYPGSGQASYAAMTELQVLDDSAPRYSQLDPRQYHGSAYGMVAAQRGYLRPAGQWNYQEVTVRGSTVRVELNGNIILDADLAEVTQFKDDAAHPGKDRTCGHFGFAGHGDPVLFRRIAIKRL